MYDARTELQKLIDEHGDDYANLSRMLGRNTAYIQQFMKRGSPKKLPEDERRTLAKYFGVGEERLGGPPPAQGSLVNVPLLAIGASAGPGAVTGDERPNAHFAFDPKWLRTVGAGDPKRLSIIQVDGDSMQPLLNDGDDILVESVKGSGKVRDGIYVLRKDDALVVKRLAVKSGGKRLSVTSDNPDHPSWPDCPVDSVEIVGRVVWAGRRIG